MISLQSNVKVSFGLLAVALGAWIAVGVHFFELKKGLLDDAFIYLHVASNVYEEGTARYFPIAKSEALVTSSPLRLLVVTIATILADVSTEARTIEAARLTLFLSGIVSALLFLPFFVQSLTKWTVGLLICAFFCSATESGLQMEGSLVFWIVYVGLTRMTTEPNATVWGVWSGLALLSRLEFGLPVFVLALAYFLRRRDLLLLLATWAALAVTWIASAQFLGVFPIPSSYLVKIVSGSERVFGPTFVESYNDRVAEYFWMSNAFPSWALVLGLVLIATVVFSRPLPFKLALLLLGCSAFLMRSAPSDVWHFENFTIALLTVAMLSIRFKDVAFSVASQTTLIRTWARGARTPILASVVLLFGIESVGITSRASTWEFGEGPSRGAAYREIGAHYLADGLFHFPGIDPCYLAMVEIGIPSYFAGSNVWMIDRGGIAQPGLLPSVRTHPLSFVYPSDVLRAVDDEFLVLSRKYGEARPLQVLKAWGMTDAEIGDAECVYAIASKGVCLQEVETR